MSMKNEYNQKKRIIFALPGAIIGGIENHLARQLKFFDKNRYEFFIFLLFVGEGGSIPDLFPKDVPIYKCGLKNLKDIKHLQKLWQLLKKIDPDIVVSSAFDGNALFRVLSLFFRFKPIPREHNLYLEKKFRLRIADHVLSYFCKTIVAVSEGVADYASQQTWVPRRKFTVIQNGINLEEVETYKKSHSNISHLKQELGLKPDDHIILNVGRLQKQKGQMLLLKAFSRFKQNTHDTLYKLVIVGEGPEERVLKQETERLGLHADVVFAGLQSNTFPYYRIADFFVLTSDREGFPNVALESFAFGVPMISTKMPGAVEIIEDGKSGFLVDAAPGKIADQMSMFSNLSPEEREQYQAHCLKTIQRFSMQENVKHYEALFEKVLGR